MIPEWILTAVYCQHFRLRRALVSFKKFTLYSPGQSPKFRRISPLGGGKPLFFPPDFFSRKNVTKILFKLEVTGLILAKSRKLGVPRAHPTCAEISVSKIFFLQNEISKCQITSISSKFLFPVSIEISMIGL